jgi:hypothetical protein
MRSLQPLVPALFGGLAALFTLALVGTQAYWLGRSLAFMAFVIVYGGLVFNDYRSGRLSPVTNVD